MRSAFLFALCVVSTALFAGQFDEEHLRIVSLAQVTCPRRVSLHGLMPTMQHEEKYSASNVLATEILIDSTHMHRLLTIFKDIKNQLHNVEHVAQFDSERVGMTAKRMAQGYWANTTALLGPDYVLNAFGPTLPLILENDRESALNTRVSLQHLEVVLQRLAYPIRYLSTWRLTWVENQKESTNKAFRTWLRRYSKETDPSAVLAAISAKTEESLAPVASAFRSKTQPNPPISLENWDAHFPAGQLPVVAARALQYLRGNFKTYAILNSPGLQALLGDLSKHTIALDTLLTQLTSTPKPAPTEPVAPPQE
jgi:hypothetical protein